MSPSANVDAANEIKNFEEKNGITQESFHQGSDGYRNTVRNKWTEILHKNGLDVMKHPTWEDKLIWNENLDQEGAVLQPKKISMSKNLFGNVNYDSGPGAGSVSVSTTAAPGGDFDMLYYSDDSGLDELEGGRRRKKTRKKRGGSVQMKDLQSGILYEFVMERVEKDSTIVNRTTRANFFMQDPNDENNLIFSHWTELKTC